MPSTYTWGDIFEESRLLGAKNVQVANNDVLICQSVSSSAWNFYPWKYTLVNTVPLSIPAVNGVQDYPRPANMYRLTRAAMWRTDVNPFQIYDYDIRKELTADLYPRAYNAIKALSDEIDMKVLRLESAINVPNAVALIQTIQRLSGVVTVILTAPLPTQIVAGQPVQISQVSDQTLAGQYNVLGTTGSSGFTYSNAGSDTGVLTGGQVNAGELVDLRVQYQPYHTTITSLDQPIWFDDSYFEMAQAGLLYKLYLFGEDSRAGSVTYDSFGHASYTGQMGVFMAAMREKAMQEDANSVQGLFPDESIGGWFNGAPGPLLLGI